MKTVLLFSGGIDSTVMLAMAKEQQKDCYLLSFDYGQRHRLELRCARAVAKHYQVPQKIVKIDMSLFAPSSLTSHIEVPKEHNLDAYNEIPSTYVPARNTIFLSYALGYAEQLEADEICCGANKDDFNAYPDCRPEYFDCFQKLTALATKQSMQKKAPTIATPLIHWSKTEIVRKGKKLDAPLDLTLSCYDPTSLGEHCSQCLACEIREKAFAASN